MPNPTVMVRQEHLKSLPALAGRMVSWHADSQKDATALGTALKRAVEAECELCGLRVTGEELARLAKPAAEHPDPDSPKVARLRLGYCARQGCNSYYYRLSFQPVPALDWAKFLEGLGDASVTQVEAGGAEQSSDRLKAAAMASVQRLAPRVLLGVLVIGALLFVRHWRRGGTVPWIREPEKFQVDVPRTVSAPNR